MSYALNEVSAMAKKAARGVGYPWGLADAAGRFARCLCSMGLDGCGALADVFDRADRLEIRRDPPVWTGTHWRAATGALCPVTLGAVLTDRAEHLLQRPVEIGNVAQPALLVAATAQIAQAIGAPVSLRVGSGVSVTDGELVSVSGRIPGEAEKAVLSCGGVLEQPRARATRAAPAPGDWQLLERFAHRTYAPATEESRRKGAG